jgi:hypothetical protein
MFLWIPLNSQRFYVGLLSYPRPSRVAAAAARTPALAAAHVAGRDICCFRGYQLVRIYFLL